MSRAASDSSVIDSAEAQAQGHAQGSVGSSEDRTRRLMGWNTIAAIIGLVLSLATLTFTAGFSYMLEKQAELLAPAAKAAAKMDADISRTIAALRGWLAYGEPRFIDERRALWRGINESFDTFVALAEQHLPEEELEGFAAFRQKLNELEYTQWTIEDVAHSTGNESAILEYDSHVLPIQRSILQAFRQGTQAVQAEVRSDPDKLFQLAVFYALFTGADTALQQYARDRSAVTLQSYEQQAQELRQLITAMEDIPDDDRESARSAMSSLIGFVTSEAHAYDTRARMVVAIGQYRRENAAQMLFRYRAQPLAEFVSGRMRYISNIQAYTTQISSLLFRKLALVIVVAALLIGIMSVSTLYVSLRIRSRVSQVLDRARKLGQYSIERKLGAGGIGEVYLARHAMLRRPAAIKLLRDQDLASRRAKEQFRAEVQLTSRLTHPNTVEIFDYGVTPDGVFYYAMEYLDGATLQQIVDATGPMPPDRVIHILQQVAGSLQEAHERGLLHRDIKPSNIMICTLGGISDTAKVLDFGLVTEVAAEVGDNKAGGYLVGTPLYIAPEAILETSGNEERSDLYALGAVGYFLLCGSPPFASSDVLDLLCKHLSDVPVPPSQRCAGPVDGELEELILQCLAKDPAERPASARELRERLGALAVANTWTEPERDAWWAQYGEVVATVVADGGTGSTAKSAMNVRVDTRGISSAATGALRS